jgi:hypothetical protein
LTAIFSLDQREEGRPGDFSALSDEELDGRLIASLTARGMTPEQALEFINRVPTRLQIEHQPVDPGEHDPAAIEKQRPGDGKTKSGAGSVRGGVGEGRGIKGQLEWPRA